jgi:hypothetical protein
MLLIDTLPDTRASKLNFPWRKPGVMQRDEHNPRQCAGILPPNVVVFKDKLANNCSDLAPKAREIVSVISVAALACPPLKPDTTIKTNKQKSSPEMVLKMPNDVKMIQERWRTVLRMAARHRQSMLLLGGLGCAVWKCSPRQVVAIGRD